MLVAIPPTSSPFHPRELFTSVKHFKILCFFWSIFAIHKCCYPQHISTTRHWGLGTCCTSVGAPVLLSMCVGCRLFNTFRSRVVCLFCALSVLSCGAVWGTCLATHSTKIILENQWNHCFCGGRIVQALHEGNCKRANTNLCVILFLLSGMDIVARGLLLKTYHSMIGEVYESNRTTPSMQFCLYFPAWQGWYEAEVEH